MGSTCLAAVREENERAPALAFRSEGSAGAGSACLAAVREENERAPAIAFRGGAWIVQE